MADVSRTSVSVSRKKLRIGQAKLHNHHNLAWWEEHGGGRMLVIRKGATPAFPGQKGFIGASMGEDAVIVEGVDTPWRPTRSIQPCTARGG